MFHLDIKIKFDHNIEHIDPGNPVQTLQKKKVIHFTSLNFQQNAYFCPTLELYIFQNACFYPSILNETCRGFLGLRLF